MHKSPEVEMALISLKKAEQDLIALKKWLNDDEISDEIIGFHIQQALEKSLKSMLLRQKIDYPHTHNLDLLIDICRDNAIQVPDTFLNIDIYNRFAVQWRYDLLPLQSPKRLDRNTAYEIANDLWVWATKWVEGINDESKK